MVFHEMCLLNRESLDRGAKLARMDREAQRQVTEAEATLIKKICRAFCPRNQPSVLSLLPECEHNMKENSGICLLQPFFSFCQSTCWNHVLTV